MLTGLEMVCHCCRGPGYANRSERKQKENWQGNYMETRLQVVFSHLCLKAYHGILAPIRCSAECVLTAWIAEAEVLRASLNSVKMRMSQTKRAARHTLKPRVNWLAAGELSHLVSNFFFIVKQRQCGLMPQYLQH